MTATPTRVRFYEHQFLGTSEFVEEQQYQISQRRRHHIAHHGWGIVTGLELVLDERKPAVRTGMAIDGYGRELLLTDRKWIPEPIFEQLGTDRIDVWLNYDLGVGDAANPPDACLSSAQPGRSTEQPYLEYRRAGVARVDARRPAEVPADTLNAPVQLETPDNALTRWPVYLGRIIRDPAARDEDQRYTIDTTDRVYVDLLAEVIDHPAVPARVEIGRQEDRDEPRTLGGIDYVFKREQGADQRRFAVFVPPPPDVALASPIELSPRLAIYDELTRLRGSTVVEGDLELIGTQLSFDVPIDPAGVDTTGDYPSLYRVEDGGGIDELRIDLGKTTFSKRSFVIGLTADDGSFRPCIRIEFKTDSETSDPQPLVTVFGDLEIKGSLLSQDTKFRTLSPEVMAALQGAFQAGVAAAGGV